MRLESWLEEGPKIVQRIKEPIKLRNVIKRAFKSSFESTVL